MVGMLGKNSNFRSGITSVHPDDHLTIMWGQNLLLMVTIRIFVSKTTTTTVLIVAELQ